MTRLAIVENSGTPREASVRTLLASDPRFRLTPVGWPGLEARTIGLSEADAIVGVAVPLPAHLDRNLEWLRRVSTGKPSLVVLPADSADDVVRMADETADDFLLSPLRPSELQQRLVRLLGPPRTEVEAVREKLLEEMGRAQLVGRDPAFLDAVDQLPRFARSGMPVLITGETGTGKELCARALHFFSDRRDSPFIAVDCAALPDHLIENELFGHSRGAYTDAHRDQRGLIAMAEGGTLFLDEIDALSLAAQGKFLRFLQDRTFRPLGADRFEHSDVNIVAATNRDLEQVVAEKRFRSDLFYRLNVLRVRLPPLRQRLGDIAVLAEHFLGELRAQLGSNIESFSAAALRCLSLHPWPGNIREFANVVQRALVVCDGKQVLPCHLGLHEAAVLIEECSTKFRAARGEAIAEFERRYVEQVLRRHDGNVTHAAREAGKERRAFGRLVKKYGLLKEES